MDYIDPEIFGELAEVLEPEVLAKRLTAFTAEIAALDAAFSALWRDSDIAALERLAHKSAGAAAMFGATPLHAVLAEIEQSARRGDIAPIPPLVHKAAALGAKTIAALKWPPASPL